MNTVTAIAEINESLRKFEADHAEHRARLLALSAVVGKAVRDERKERNRSVREIARRTGLSAAHISDLELGKKIWSDALLKKINKALRSK